MPLIPHPRQTRKTARLTRIFSASLLAMVAGEGAGAADGHRQHDAHRHGQAMLNIAVDNHSLYIELESPAADILGFEARPQSAARLTQAQQALALLGDGAAQFGFAPESRCRAVESSVEAPWLGGPEVHGHDSAQHGDHDQDGDTDGSHNDIVASYRFHCDGGVRQIAVHLMRHFPRTQRVEVQFVTPAGQGAASLTPGRAVLRW